MEVLSVEEEKERDKPGHKGELHTFPWRSKSKSSFPLMAKAFPNFTKLLLSTKSIYLKT
jgi:hypothetical protein